MSPATDQQSESGIVPRQRTTIVAGGAAGNFTVTGIRVGDFLAAVYGFILVEGAPNTFTLLNLLSEFTITANDTINNTGGTASTAGVLFVTYYDNPNVD